MLTEQRQAKLKKKEKLKEYQRKKYAKIKERERN